MFLQIINKLNNNTNDIKISKYKILNIILTKKKIEISTKNKICFFNLLKIL